MTDKVEYGNRNKRRAFDADTRRAIYKFFRKQLTGNGYLVRSVAKHHAKVAHVQYRNSLDNDGMGQSTGGIRPVEVPSVSGADVG
jgi:hypothetical protein